MKHLLKTITILFVFLIFSINVIAASEPVSWYCIRNKEHRQPSLGRDLAHTEKYDLFWCDKRHQNIDDADKVIYLTFDAGYDNGNVEKIVKTLKEENVKATFFILDNMILKNGELVKEMIDDGHIVANHTLKHKDMTKMKTKEEFARELQSLEALYKSTYGVEMPKFYRPPEGRTSEQNLSWARELGYKTVMWSFAYADWDNNKQPSCEAAMKKIMDNLHNGEVMLLHPTSLTNATILKELIVTLKEQGYRFATVEELCSQ